MSTQTSDALIQIRVPADLKERTSKLFRELGTNTSAVVNMMLVQADKTKSIPFRVHSDGYPLSANERIEEVAATMALEDLPLTEEDIKELQEVELGLKSDEEVIQKIITENKED